nr:P3-P5 fusion protein [Strawberry polerovirus 1]
MARRPRGSRGGKGKKKQNAGRRNPSRMARPAQPIYVVQRPPNQGTGRRGRRNRNRRLRAQGYGLGGKHETLKFTKEDIKRNSSGYITFGPSLSEHPAFSNGNLKAYKHYRITRINVEYLSESTDQAPGAIKFEMDTSLSATKVTSPIHRFPIKKNGRYTWTAPHINGQLTRETTSDQCRFLYEATTTSTEPAGVFNFTYDVHLMDNKYVEGASPSPSPPPPGPAPPPPPPPPPAPPPEPTPAKRVWGYDGTPVSKISTARNDQNIDVKSLNSIRLWKWENESWTDTVLTANYSKNDRVEAIPYFLVPVAKGTHRVYIECEGDYGVKSIGGKADGCWGGIICFDSKKDGWMARPYSSCKMTNYKARTTFVCGHPDAELNGCKFPKERGVESDCQISFHLEVEDDGYFAMQPPPIQKSHEYNYDTSYAAYTDKNMEWGSISISIDEVDTARPGYESTFRNKPEKPNSITRWTSQLNVEKLVVGAETTAEETNQQSDQIPVGTYRKRASDDDYPLLYEYDDNPPDSEIENWEFVTPTPIAPDLPRPVPRTETRFAPKATLLRKVDPEHFDTNPSIDEAERLAEFHRFTPAQNREAAEQMEVKTQNKRETWAPSVAGSTSSRFTGNLRGRFASRPDPRLAQLTTEQRRAYESERNSLGSQAAKIWLDNLFKS